MTSPHCDTHLYLLYVFTSMECTLQSTLSCCDFKNSRRTSHRRTFIACTSKCIIVLNICDLYVFNTLPIATLCLLSLPGLREYLSRHKILRSVKKLSQSIPQRDNPTDQNSAKETRQRSILQLLPKLRENLHVLSHQRQCGEEPLHGA